MRGLPICCAEDRLGGAAHKGIVRAARRSQPKVSATHGRDSTSAHLNLTVGGADVAMSDAVL
jgi:hypothetical protein